MEVQSLYDENDTDFEEVSVALVRLAKKIPDHELFFRINHLNDLTFTRIDDLIFSGIYFDYRFPRFQTYHKFSKTCFTFISNKSSESIRKKEQRELFTGEEDIKFLLNNNTDVEYIIHSSEQFPDFSVILLPENLVFPMQDYLINSHDEFYKIIQYYE